jgi:hypothetical protein
MAGQGGSPPFRIPAPVNQITFDHRPMTGGIPGCVVRNTP